ncbi:unnamed protein product [Schistosoma bovis]|nr:unnamed protein product [Schistosoma bovis]CAH8639349.1 unnamed protein product [Schistosoma bovis]CAH8649633.1 unnamed protein product [Schistosoma haematobium]CAH8656708.1 unnamed protein product [Schistosoma haematobium]
MDTLSESDFNLSESLKSYPTFASMGLKENLLKGIYAYGFEKPSLIQQKTIKQITLGRDLIAQAQSGTGKTATFSIGTLQNVLPEICQIQVLVLAPTRELAFQIHHVMSSLSDYLSIRCVSCCGGRNNTMQMARELDKGVHVVVGTPGRILELLRQGNIRLNKLRSLVLDEADEMLNRGLHDQLEEIYRRLPSHTNSNNKKSLSCQIVIISATMLKEHLELFQNFTSNPVCVLVPRDELSLSDLQQFYIDVGSEEWKFEALNDLFSSVCVSQTVVFVNTRRKVEWLASQLKREGFTVAAAHGDLDQSQRESVMKQFRSGECRILISSDMWARGIDVQTVGLVVNFDLPMNTSEYLHRIGRSGRFGRTGLAVSFIANAEERKQLLEICNYYQIAIPPAPARLDKMLVINNSVHSSPKIANSPCKSDTSNGQPVKHHQLAKHLKRKKKQHKRKKKLENCKIK